MDMSRSYQAAANKYLGIPIVFDRFHLMQQVSKTIDKVRKTLTSSLDDSERKVLKKSRYLLLKNFSNLDDQFHERLYNILDLNEPLLVMYMMKEELKALWDRRSRNSAKKFLRTWVFKAVDTAIEYRNRTGCKALVSLEKLATSLLRHSEGILNYFNYRISNGRQEGINNKIKTLKRQAYGYRDLEYFKLRLLHLHKQKSGSLIG